jgi:hypothetical protein
MGLRTILKPEIHHGIVTNSERVDTYGPTASLGRPNACAVCPCRGFVPAGVRHEKSPRSQPRTARIAIGPGIQ